MGQFTLVKPKIGEIIKANDLCDENEIMILTKALIKGAPDGNGKTGFFSTMFVPIDFVVALKGDTLNLIQAPRRGFFVELPSVTQKEIDNAISISKLQIGKIYAVKVLGGQKLHINLLSGEEVVIDVTKKLESAFDEIVNVLKP